ncbi:dihydroxyacetone kinase subunit DhaL [Nonomuraea sp. NPDC050556]|uniref:dihydroxyacetone kinase subunit DhaL n=1 Tax=Nonomuraea sp. NPDC050556 TaxID=3364369 RepID=UPI00378783A2
MDGAFFAAWITEAARLVAVERERLTTLDAAIGDADHGTNLERGFSAAVEELPSGPPGDVLTHVGNTLIRRVGGASGPLYGSAFRAMGKALGEASEVSLASFASALQAGVDAVSRLGKASVGDKTMIDALVPAAQALTLAVQEGVKQDEALARTVRAAEEGARATVPLQARKGRASYLGPRSVGHQDPGATSSALILSALLGLGLG